MILYYMTKLRGFCRVNSVQLLSCVWLFATSWAAVCQASLSVSNSWNLLKLMSIESVMPSNLLILCFFLFFLFTYLFSFTFISWRLITLQYCSGLCHTLTWISHGVTCIPHPDPLSHLLLHPIPLGLPSAPGPSPCLMHPAWAGYLFHPR